MPHPISVLNAGTAGVWRISALNEAGGWKDRTTVEDMDLAVRASLKGWKFVYIADLKVFTKLSLFKKLIIFVTCAIKKENPNPKPDLVLVF